MSDVLSCRQLTANLKMIAGAIGCLNRNDVAQIISPAVFHVQKAGPTR